MWSLIIFGWIFTSFEDSTKSSHKDTAPSRKFNNLFSEDEKESDGGTIQRLKEFCGYTTAHGLGRLVDSKSYVRRLLWVMACLGAFTMFTSQVISLAEQYLSKPVETYITMKYVRVRTWLDILKNYDRKLMFKYLPVNDNCLATFDLSAPFSYLFLLLIFLSRHLRGKGWRIDPSTVFFSF